jgi:hypothetical protein
MSEYTSLILGAASGLIVFLSMLAYMKNKAANKERLKAQNRQARLDFNPPIEHHDGELMGHR